VVIDQAEDKSVRKEYEKFKIWWLNHNGRLEPSSYAIFEEVVNDYFIYMSISIPGKSIIHYFMENSENFYVAVFMAM